MTEETTQRRLATFTSGYGRTAAERRHQQAVVSLAVHAALPVVLDADLLHLLRLNFLPHLPYTAEAYVLLSPLCSEIGGGLYAMSPPMRTVLLRQLVQEDGPVRLGEIATLLWTYSRERAPWVGEEGLEKAQELTALNFLDPLAARAWLETAEMRAAAGETSVPRAWYVAMGQELAYGEQAARQIEELQGKQHHHDIFLSYANADLPRVLPLVRALERHGWSVWWDRERILPGRAFHRVIEDALRVARCVLVAWSSLAVESEWVVEEAEEGRTRGILIPVRLDTEAQIPFGFRNRQAVLLHDWQATEAHRGFDLLVEALTALLGPPSPQGTRLPVLEPPAPPPPPEPAPEPDRYVNSVGMAFISIPAGEFLMGSADGDADERPVHRVRISHPFYLGTSPVTEGQWEAVMGSKPSRYPGDAQRPVEQVSWEETQAFIRQLNAQEPGMSYRLPTEAEWEYAVRAGTTTAYSHGDDAMQLGQYAWYNVNAGRTAHPVGQLQPNAWGLYDMHGNVWEWVQDWYGPYTAALAVDPQGPASGARRVFRGGSWIAGARYCRSADRSYVGPGSRLDGLGVRLLRTAP